MPRMHDHLPPLWDIFEEHFEEAAFIAAQWEQSLAAPNATLETVALGPEARWLAHADGLLLGGVPVARELLLPAFAGKDSAKVFVAAYALLSSEDAGGADAVFQALGAAADEGRPALGRALMLAPPDNIGARLTVLLPKASPEVQATLLDALAFRRVDPGMHLDPFLVNGAAVLRCAALRAARFFPDRAGMHLVERAMGSPEPAERKAALEAGLVLGSKAACSACEKLLSRFEEGWGDAAVLWALSGNSDLGLLLAGLEDPRWTKSAVWALGFTGRCEAADALGALVSDGEVGRSAAEAFAAVTGLPPAAPFFAPPQAADEGPLEAEPRSHRPEDELPVPIQEELEEWWSTARPRFSPEARYLGGEPWGLTPLVKALSNGPMRRRGPLALELAIRTRGNCCITTDAFTRRQRRELADAQANAGRFETRSPRGGSPFEPQRAGL